MSTFTVKSADGVPVVYEVRGAGTPALVFVHGWSCDRSYWDGQSGPFSRDFRVVTVDLAGHGESGLERAAWTIEAFGEDVAAVVEALGLELVVLIGHSMGGDVIVEAARQLRGRVEGLVWVDTYMRLGTSFTLEQLEALAAPLRADFEKGARALVRGMFRPDSNRALVERIVSDMAAAPPAIALGTLESAKMCEPDVIAGLHQLNLPVVAINPDYRPTDVESMERHGVSVVVMPDVGHFLMMEDPARFNPLLRDVIEGFVSTRRPITPSLRRMR